MTGDERGQVGCEDEPQESGAIVAVHYGDYRRRDQREKKASGRRGARSDRAEQRFRDFLEGIGAELLEDEFLGVMYKHRTRCAAGHECLVTPNSAAARGRRGICRICARQDPATAESTFREQVVGLGGVVLEPPTSATSPVGASTCAATSTRGSRTRTRAGGCSRCRSRRPEWESSERPRCVGCAGAVPRVESAAVDREPDRGGMDRPLFPRVTRPRVLCGRIAA